jgi:hypothetical protein
MMERETVVELRTMTASPDLSTSMKRSSASIAFCTVFDLPPKQFTASGWHRPFNLRVDTKGQQVRRVWCIS